MINTVSNIKRVKQIMDIYFLDVAALLWRRKVKSVCLSDDHDHHKQSVGLKLNLFIQPGHIMREVTLIKMNDMTTAWS